MTKPTAIAMTVAGIAIAIAALLTPWPAGMRTDITFVSLLLTVWLCWNGIGGILDHS